MSWDEIHEQLSRNLDPVLSRNLYQVYHNVHIPLIVRRKYSSWFEDQNWPDAMDEQTAQDLYNELLSSIHNDISTMRMDQELVLEAVELSSAASTIEEYFAEDPIRLVQAVIKGLDGEKTIISGYNGPEKMDEEVAAEVKATGDKYRNQLLELSNQIEQLITMTTKASSHLTCSNQIRADLIEVQNEFGSVTQNAELNGQRDAYVTLFREKIRESTELIGRNITDFTTTKQEIQKYLREMVKSMEELTSQIMDEVKNFQHLQKLAYVRAESSEKVRILLQEIEEWCGDLGNCCWKLIQQMRSPDLREVISTAHRPLNNGQGPLTPVLAAEDHAEVEELGRSLEKMFRDMLEKTFIVTTQPPELIKMVGTKGTGYSRGDCNMSVGILALNCLQIEQISTNVTARFTAETDIGRERKVVTCELQNSEAQFKTIGRKKAEACFSDLKVTKFSRAKENDDNRVSKQFYRLILKTKVTVLGEWEMDLETMSLPIIVNTGSNQACEALGSLLWYCYNTEDIYSNLNQVAFPNEVPLERVLSMLNSCLKAISPRELKDDERRFLGEKLTGKAIKKSSADSSPMVSFHQFCVVSLSNKMRLNKEKNVEFSFWKWFQAVINLVDKYLKEPWRDGVIKGFVSKSTVQRILMNQAPGTFLIRFSESCVNGDHQGVTGGIVVAVRYEDIVTFSPPRVEGHLSKTSLAAILRQFINQKNGENLLKTLYKSNCSREARESAFKKYDRVPSDKKNEQYYSGYPGWVAFLGLDRDFSAMKLNDVEDDIWKVQTAPGIPQPVAKHGVKRPRKSPEHTTSQSPPSSWPMTSSPGQSNSSTSSSSNIPNFLQDMHQPKDSRTAEVEQFQKMFGNYNMVNFTPHGTGAAPVTTPGTSFQYNIPNTQPLSQSSASSATQHQSNLVHHHMTGGSPSSHSSASTNDCSVENTHSPSSLSPDLIEIEPTLYNFGQDQGMPNTPNTPNSFLEMLTGDSLLQ